MALPAFTPSGSGLMNDFKVIQRSQAIAWGSHKSKLIKLLEEVAGIQTINGKEVYGNIDLLNETCTPDTPTMELMELFGVDEEQRLELCAVETDNTLDQFMMIYSTSLGQSPDDWDNYIDLLADQLANATDIGLTAIPVTYSTTGGVPIYTPAFGVTKATSDNVYANATYGTTAETDYVDNAGTLTARNTRLMNIYGITILNSGVDVTSQYDVSTQKGLIAMLLMEGVNAFPEISKTFTEILNGAVYEIHTVEFYSTAMDRNYMKARYDDYTLLNEAPNENPDSLEPRVPGPENGYYFPFYWANIWLSTYYIFTNDYFLDTIEADSNGLFTYNQDSGANGYVFMTVEGLQKSTYDNFGFYVSAFMTIHAHQTTPTGLTKIFVGIMRAFAKAIDALVGFFLKIPILKQFLEAVISLIMKYFNLEYDSARGVLTQVIMAIIVIVVSIYFPPAIGMTSTVGATGAAVAASGVSVGVMSAMITMVEVASAAFSVINTTRSAALSYGTKENEYENEKDKLEFIRNDNSPISQANFGTLGSVDDKSKSDEMMYNFMFNPFDTLQQAIPAVIKNDIIT